MEKIIIIKRPRGRPRKDINNFSIKFIKGNFIVNFD